MSAKASGSSAANGDAKQRANDHHDGSSGRAFTAEQKAAVIRVRKCSPEAFYDILGLETVRKSCSDSDIKKAYRKLSLLTHPDKNGYAGADEAFKMVSRAFQILSDADKKARYDKFGGDPDSRSAPSASTSSPFSGFSGAQRGAARGGGMWEEEISPEEMFRQFFGGGGMGGFGGPFGGGLFDTGPQFVFNMGGGGPGIRVHQFGGNRPRRRPHNHEAAAQPPSAISALQSLLPLLLLFLLPLLSSLFSSSAPSGPNMRFDAAVPPHTLQHVSQRLKVPYWVVPSEVSDYTSKKWRDLDRVAEGKYVGQLNTECELEQQRRQRLYQEAQGFFWTDNEKLNQARAMEMRSCKRLGELGYRV